MSEHTQGKLIADLTANGSFSLSAPGKGGGGVALLIASRGAHSGRAAEMHANARRLAACWNALGGVPTNEIESAAQSGSIVGALFQVLFQRDELLSALKLIESAESSEYCKGVAKAAIAKAEGQP